MWIFTTESGNFYKESPNSGTRTLVSLPSGVAIKAPETRPSFARFNLSGSGYLCSYIVGQYDSMLVWTPDQALVEGGIEAPVAAPVAASAAGTGLSGEVIVSFTWAQYENGNLIHEGNPSPKTTAITLADQGLSVSSVPATAPDARTTHWNLYVSVDGSLSHKAASVALGNTSTTVNIDNTELFEAVTLPTKIDADGVVVDDVLARGVPPYATIQAVWHQRNWLIDPTRAGVLYSYLEEMESFNEDDDLSFIPMPGGEYPIGMCGLDDELVVFCENVIYSVTGYGESSFSVRRVSDGIRFIAPHSVVNIFGVLFFASDQGICGYMGGGGNSVRNFMARSWRSKWIDDYADNTVAYENATADFDRVYGDYVFCPDTSTTRTIRGYVRPMVEEGESEPWWYYGEVRTRATRAVGQLYQGVSHRGLISYGDSNGYVYFDDVDDADDDSDTNNKRFVVVGKVYMFGDQSGDSAHGRTYTNVNWFGRQGDVDVTINLYCGDDTCVDGAVTKSFDCEPLENVPGQTTEATSRQFALAETSGKGVAFGISVDNPTSSVQHRGFSIYWREGPQTRN